MTESDITATRAIVTATGRYVIGEGHFTCIEYRVPADGPLLDAMRHRLAQMEVTAAAAQRRVENMRKMIELESAK